MTHRLPGLDLLRSFAIVWVMLFHSFLLGGLGPDWSWLSRYGWMGVDLFFVLSGFLIGSQVLGPPSRGQPLLLGDFYWRRALRILPAFWAMLLLYLLVPALREERGMEPWWKFITFTLNLDIDYARNATFSHAWSLCVEEHFYWVFPLLVIVLFRRPAAWKFWTLCVALVAGGIALRTAIWIHDGTANPAIARNWFVEDIYYPTWNRLDGLVFGVMLAAWKTLRPHSWARARRHANAFFAAGVLAMALAFWLFRDRVGLLGNSIGWPVLSAAMALFVFAAAGRDSVIGRRNVPIASWLAGISYSLYLVHKAMYHVVQAQWGSWLANHVLVGVMVYGGTAIAAGAMLHYLVERPFLRLRERLPFGRRKERVATTA
jgi:peptidoglycan/LPS O-acetylase OafA/YrhL